MLDYKILAFSAAVLLAAFSTPFSARADAVKDAEKQREISARADRLYKGLNVRRDVVYKKSGGRELTMDLILPEKNLYKNGAPVLMNIHGGGWNGGDRYHVGGAWARGLGEMGIAVATISYTFAEEGKADVRDCITDCKDAARFLAKNAKKFGIDPSRIMTTGHSAGGHLSLMTALAPDEKFPGDPSLKGFKPGFAGAIGFAPAVSFDDPEHDYPGTVSHSASCFARLVGGSPQEIAALKKAGKTNAYEFLKENFPGDPRIKIAEDASPARYISKSSCPVLIIHGDKDTLVSYKASRHMAESASKAGADIIYVEVSGADHGLRGENLSVSPESQGKIKDLFVIRHLLDGVERR